MLEITYNLNEVISVQEYVLIILTKQGQNMLEHVPWMLRYLITREIEDNYDKALFLCWCHQTDEIDDLLSHTFQNRYDYRQEGHLHTLYNELTKEIAIIIVNRYQIILKCDKIPYVVIQTIRDRYPTLRLFCRNKDFEEVKL